MDKTAVQIRPSVPVTPACDVPERIDPVRVIQMPIKPENLAEDGLDVAKKSLWESALFAYPVVASKLGQRSSEVGRPEGNGRSGSRGAEAARGVSGGSGRDGGVGGEGFWVVDFADDPALNQGDVLGGGDFDWYFVIVEPGVCVATKAGLVQEVSRV